MDYVVQGAQLLLSLSILIVLHEFGHYLPARWFNTRVEKFYLFFDYKISLFKKKIKDTEWGIGWIPLGGYVKISGMIDESMDKEQMAKPPESWEFRSKPAWQRMIIMIGGITVNLIVGVVIYVMIMFVWGEQIITADKAVDGMAVQTHFEQFGFQDGDKILTVNGKKPKDVSRLGIEIAFFDARVFKVEHPNGEIETITLPEDIDMSMFKADAMTAFAPRLRNAMVIDSVVPDRAANASGLLKGDKVLAVNGQNLTYWDEVRTSFAAHKMESLELDIERDGKIQTLNITPDSLGQIGAYNNAKASLKAIVSDVEYGFFASIPRGIKAGLRTLTLYVKQFKYVFTSKGASSVGGFGAIGSLFEKTWDWRSFWGNTAFISIVLAFMNFLPIPALDGGHLMFLSYEIISGRKPNEKFMEYAQMAGMIFLLALLLFANGNDIYKWLTGS